MAKDKHQNQGNGLDAFVLQEGAYGEVESHVGTLNIDSADGTTIKFAKSDLQTKKTRKRRRPSGEIYEEQYDDWRFSGTRYMPFPRKASSIDEFMGSMQAFAQDLEAFDNAEAFTLPNGRSGRKSYKILVDTKGNPISAASYLYNLMVAAHTLASQKTMQAKLRDLAETKLRAERNIASPVTKVRTKKVVDNEVDEGGELANDL